MPCLVRVAPLPDTNIESGTVLCSILGEDASVIDTRNIKRVHLCPYSEGSDYVTPSTSECLEILSLGGRTEPLDERELKRKREEVEEEASEALSRLMRKVETIVEMLEASKKEADNLVQHLRLRQSSFSRTCDNMMERAVEAKRETLRKT